MPLDFPSNPVNGQVYDNYYYDAAMDTWRAQGSGAALNTFVGPTISNPTITGGSISGLSTDLAISDGGTGASDAATARSNLGAAAISGTSFTGAVSVEAGGGGFSIKATQSQDHAYMSFYPRTASPSTRMAYFGYPANGSNDLTLYNEISGGNLTLGVAGSGRVNLPSQTYFPGAIVQVQQVHTNTVSYQTSHEIANIAGLSIAFTPKFSNSKILLTAAINSDIRYVATFGFRRDGNVVSGTNNTNSTGSVATVYYGTDTNTHIMNTYIEIAEGAGSTATRTYTAAACASWAGNLQTLTINDRGSSLDMRSISSMTIYEIAQ